jgi:CSLREA domain-containing protein
VRALRNCSAAAVATCALLVMSASASAKSYVVTKKSDPVPGSCKKHDCSLREAITAANAHHGGDTIVLPSPKGAYVIAQENHPKVGDESIGDFDISGPLTIEHNGKGRATVDGKQIDRVFDATSKLELAHLRVTGGARPSDPGGGIRSSSSLTIRDSIFDHNGAADGGAIQVSGTDPKDKLTIVDSRIEKNLAQSSGGIDANNTRFTIRRSRISGNIGGAMYGRIGGTINESTISGNTGGYGSGGLTIDYKLTLLSSTVSGNESAYDGGGINNDFGPLAIRNSTISGNRSGGRGGGIYTGASLGDLNAVTVSGNAGDTTGLGTSTWTGGIFVDTNNAGPITIANSIVSGNTRGPGSGSPSDCSGGTLNTLGHNILGNVGCPASAGPTDIVSDNPGLNPLGKNGGPTKTMALKKGSVAIGKANKRNAPEIDQRGRVRDKHPDIGAFER